MTHPRTPAKRKSKAWDYGAARRDREWKRLSQQGSKTNDHVHFGRRLARDGLSRKGRDHA